MELSILRNYQQTPNKIIKNQGENKNKSRSGTFYSHESIQFIADLIGPLPIVQFLLSNIYIYIYIFIYI